jgi:hypothetical protein
VINLNSKRMHREDRRISYRETALVNLISKVLLTKDTGIKFYNLQIISLSINNWLANFQATGGSPCVFSVCPKQHGHETKV